MERALRRLRNVGFTMVSDKDSHQLSSTDCSHFGDVELAPPNVVFQDVVVGNIEGSDNPNHCNQDLKTDADQLAEQGVTTAKIRDAAVQTAKIDNIQVTTEKINDNAVTTNQVADRNITADKQANNVVMTGKIAADNPRIAKMFANITAEKVAKSVITTNKIDSESDIVLAVMKGIFPVGSVYITFVNKNPPFHGAGITWEVLPEGHAVMTANCDNTGTCDPGNRLDSGKTAGHALSIAQMPSHNHAQGVDGKELWKFRGDFDLKRGPGMKVSTTLVRKDIETKRGGGQAHRHNLNISNQKLLFWRRTS